MCCSSVVPDAGRRVCFPRVIYTAPHGRSARSLAAPAPRSFSRSALFQPLLSPSPHTFCPKSYLRFGFTQSQPHSSAPATSASTSLPVAASSAACLAAVSEEASASENLRSVYMSFSLSSRPEKPSAAYKEAPQQDETRHGYYPLPLLGYCQVQVHPQRPASQRHDLLADQEGEGLSAARHAFLSDSFPVVVLSERSASSS